MHDMDLLSNTVHKEDTVSTNYPPATPAEPPSQNLAQLRDRILARDDLDPVRRRNLASALRSLSKALGQPLDTIPADPVELRRRLNGCTPAMAGLSAGRWRNVRSLLQAALEDAGIVRVAGRSRRPPSATWAALLASLGTYNERYKLSRFASWCSAGGVQPDDVDDAVMDRYLAGLRDSSLVAKPDRIQRDTAVVWNRCAAACPGWPQRRLAVPDNRGIYAVPWSMFPASLKDDVDAWLDRQAGRDPMAELDFRPLRPASLASRRKQVHLFISALVLRGENPAQLRSLADVVTPERAGQGLMFFWERAGGAPSVHGGHMASMLLAIARHWVGADDASIKRLRMLARRIRPEASGMTARNRERLRPLDDPRTLRSLLTLPGRIRGEVLRAGTPNRTTALDLQAAVAIELLIMAPIRMGNLNRLRCGVHLIRGRDGGVTLALGGHEVKNRMPFEVRLPDDTARLLDLYETHYRPLLNAAGGDWLFPGQRADAPKSSEGLRAQLQKCLRVRCGLAFHPHLFRHAAAKLILENNPGAHGLVQRVLGHKKMATTLQHYTGLETQAAVAHYDTQVIRLREDGVVPPPARPRRWGSR